MTTGFNPDNVVPDQGTLFDLTEDARSITLVEMIFLSELQKGTTTITCPQGLDALESGFKVKSCIKIGTTWLNVKLVWYVPLETHLRA
jgi:hypothetical protein